MLTSSEITEEQEQDEEDNPDFIKSDVQKQRIRRIIQYQKSLYWSSSSSSSSSLSSAAAAASTSSNPTSSKRSSLLQLMKGGSTCLKRLFEMEHTSLSNHFNDYSASPITKSIPLWGSSDTDGEDFWAYIKQSDQSFSKLESGSKTGFASDGSFIDKEIRFNNRKMKRLTRKKSFRKLPGFRLRLRRLRIMICGRKF